MTMRPLTVVAKKKKLSDWPQRWRNVQIISKQLKINQFILVYLVIEPLSKEMFLLGNGENICVVMPGKQDGQADSV